MPSVGTTEDMTPGERLAEVAAILARGVLTLRRKAPGARRPSFEESPESGENGLDSRRDVSPHVDTGQRSLKTRRRASSSCAVP